MPGGQERQESKNARRARTPGGQECQEGKNARRARSQEGKNAREESRMPGEQNARRAEERRAERQDGKTVRQQERQDGKNAKNARTARTPGGQEHQEAKNATAKLGKDVACVHHNGLYASAPREKLKLVLRVLRVHVVFQPLFKAVSQLWSGLKDEADLLTFLADLAVNLQPFITSQAKLFSEAFLSDLLGASQVKTDEQRMTKTTDERMNPAEMEQEWLLPETGRGFNQLPLQYGGFCGYTLVSTDGILLPGNPHIGVLKHKDKLYAFSSKDAAVKFASRPDDFIAAVEEKAKCSPELIQLLRLQQFSSIVPYCEMQSAENPAETGTVKAETGTNRDSPSGNKHREVLRVERVGAQKTSCETG
ncbi:cilia- and flagella-associated protein 206-like [Thalassophryne amazonica]|uniref:cilia- and flagella-associated protein 206-like n=1 Tax=Thalassophryne amazonica TaxID=390379 RepID=UPI001470A661|nr:cilia- and flagella-associated protein 206-like [Thalassophryne amazonica]